MVRLLQSPKQNTSEKTSKTEQNRGTVVLDSMDSTTHQNHQHNSGLLRFRSDTSSLLSKSNIRNTGGFFNSGRLKSIFREPSEEKTGEEPAIINYGNSQPSYVDSSFELLGMGHRNEGKPVSSSITWQINSLPGLSSDSSVLNGYGNMKSTGNYCGINGEPSTSPNRLKNQISFSSRQSSSPLSMLSRISEIRNESIGVDTSGDEARFHHGSRNDSANIRENFSVLKRTLDDHHWKLFSNNQNRDVGSCVRALSQHSSLAHISNEMAVGMENFIHFQESFPCKMRAKRGCATHPRSIAERVRRTRISERMRKLQELVPNMDKQTNTADMLDLAVEYIKDLQKQFKTLSDNRANCKCLNIQKPYLNQEKLYHCFSE